MRSDNSSYLRYLPPALWSRDRDPSQFLGRMLRVFEKILTGIPIEAHAVRAEASIVDADDTQIQLADSAEAARFRRGDLLTVNGTAERVQIENIIDDTLILNTPLIDTYSSGTVRIADMLPGQTIFRIDKSSGLGPGIIIEIQQGTQNEKNTVSQVTDGFVTLHTALAHTYSMTNNALPVMVQDGLAVQNGNRVYEPLETTLDNLHLIYDPWQTRTDLLPWLGTWLALASHQDWDEYQQRKIISEIVAVYQLRGFKKGLHAYLDIFAVTEAQPRITIDDGDAVFRLVLKRGVAETVHAVASGQPLLHPIALAIDGTGNYIITDQGDEDLSPPAGPGPAPASLVRLSASGESSFTNDPLPAPELIHQGAPLFTPTGVVVESTGAYVVVDTGPAVPPSSPAVSGIYRFAPPDYTPSVVIDNQPATVPKLPAIYPVDLLRIADGHFAVLDRGTRFPNSASPQIIIYREGSPPTLTMHPLASVSEPTGFVRNAADEFTVIDAGPGLLAEPIETLRSADIYQVDISSDPAVETSLLGALPSGQNPLIYPSAVVFEDAGHILVSDFGSKPPGRFARLAEPAALYRVSLPPLAPSVRLVSRDRNYVRPSALALDSSGAVIMLDQGESQDQAPARSWRTKPNEFGVIVYFSEERPIDRIQKSKLLTSIRRIIDAEKPVHTHWTLKHNQL